MPRLLFTVKSLFTIKGRGVVAEPGVEDYKAVRIGDPIELRRPDGTIVQTTILGVEYSPSIKWVGPRPAVVRCGVLLGLAAEDIPPGTEIWAV